MLNQIEQRLRSAIAAFVQAKGVEFDAASLPVEFPPNAEMGDLSVPMFPLAKALKKAPKVIAQEIATFVTSIEGIARAEAAGAGYLNVFLDKGKALQEIRNPEREARNEARRTADSILEKIIVEHTNINPNKAAHVGHLRNAVLGDTWVRLLRASGYHVEVQNLIDDLGLQVADVVIAFLDMEGRELRELQAWMGVDASLVGRESADLIWAENRQTEREVICPRSRSLVDDCWDAYTKVQAWFAEDKSREALRKTTLQNLEHGEGERAAAGRAIAEAVCRSHMRLMESLNIHYDLLVWESDILAADLWREAFEKLKSTGGIVEEKGGKNAGCWVMPLSRSEKAEFKNLEDPDKVLLRSDGTATYVAKDIALQMFKHGLIEARFSYKPFLRYRDGKPLWRSWSKDEGEKNHPTFGRGARAYNVIDVRQSYLQDIVSESLRLCGFDAQADASIHFSYEMVALTPKTAERLGFALTDEEKKKPYIEMSGRKGLGVKAEDLLSMLKASAYAEIKKRNPILTPAQVEDAAKKIAVAALRYFMLRYTRNKVVAFDIDEAVQFEGETGPYLQYALVRVKNIFEKCGEAGIVESELRHPQWSLDSTAWNLLMACARFKHALAAAVKSEEPSVFARYAFDLAQAWNGFYHGNPILQEKDEATRYQRLALAKLFEATMVRALEILGIETPERM